MKKLISSILICLIFFTSTISPLSLSQAPYVNSESAILIDFESADILYSKNIHKKMFPASTTKIMTALLVLENTNLNDIININYNLGPIDGNSMYLKKGESFTVEELLKVLMVRSANDVAVAFANHISGSVDNFAKLMNKKAKSLGCKNTNFTNPNGLPDKNHYTSAYDLALISREAMKHEKLREIVKTPKVQIAPNKITPEGRIFKNSNRFLWGQGGKHTMQYNGKTVDIKYDLIDGIKTGYTTVARQCLATSAIKDDLRLISVVLKCNGKDIYINSRKLIDYGFENYTREKILSKDEILGSKHIKNSKEKTLKFTPISNVYLTLNKEYNVKNLKKEIILNENLKAPIKKGDIVGKIEIYKANKLVSSTSIKSTCNLSVSLIETYFLEKLNSLLSLIKIVILITSFLFISLFILKKIFKHKNKKRF